MESYVLYQYPGCPFCARVLTFLGDRGIDLELKNTLIDPTARLELLAGGGRTTVPCLKIEDTIGTRWLYESLDIMRYLDARAT